MEHGRKSDGSYFRGRFKLRPELAKDPLWLDMYEKMADGVAGLDERMVKAMFVDTCPQPGPWEWNRIYTNAG